MSGSVPFQRIGSTSNAHVGRHFELIVAEFFIAQGIELKNNFAIEVGHGGRTKPHRFDLGSKNPPILAECKSHRWTSGGNSPSAKMTVWNEAMYYFHLAPEIYRKCFCVLRDSRTEGGITLAEHYLRNYSHLVPNGVEFWEFNGDTGHGTRIR